MSVESRLEAGSDGSCGCSTRQTSDQLGMRHILGGWNAYVEICVWAKLKKILRVYLLQVEKCVLAKRAWDKKARMRQL